MRLRRLQTVSSSPAKPQRKTAPSSIRASKFPSCTKRIGHSRQCCYMTKIPPSVGKVWVARQLLKVEGRMPEQPILASACLHVAWGPRGFSSEKELGSYRNTVAVPMHGRAINIAVCHEYAARQQTSWRGGRSGSTRQPKIKHISTRCDDVAPCSNPLVSATNEGPEHPFAQLLVPRREA